jgi:hypothetical protein
VQYRKKRKWEDVHVKELTATTTIKTIFFYQFKILGELVDV